MLEGDSVVAEIFNGMRALSFLPPSAIPAACKLLVKWANNYFKIEESTYLNDTDETSASVTDEDEDKISDLEVAE